MYCVKGESEKLWIDEKAWEGAYVFICALWGSGDSSPPDGGWGKAPELL